MKQISGNLNTHLIKTTTSLMIIKSCLLATPIKFLEYKFNLKGTGSLQYHLGVNFERNELGVCCMSPKKYIDRMVDYYASSHLEYGDHPELDDSELLYELGIQI